MGGPVGEDARLSTAGPCNDKDRTVDCAHRITLDRIEFLEE
jgi:hypothetical protein